MIAVIADDFTGAAEIGGIGLRYGLNVIIESEVKDVPDVDLLVIATDTRSWSQNDACKEVVEITNQLMKLKPKLIFKKIDSVFRGHVAKEIEAQMLVTGKNKTMIVAANPSVGRTIVNGQYFINSLPLNETFFADDPDFPTHTAKVTDIVKSSKFPVISLGLNDALPDTGLIIADVTSHEELEMWTSRVDDNMFIAGGSGFFGALLGTIYPHKSLIIHNKLLFRKSTLFVFGSKYPKSTSMLGKFENGRIIRMNMPGGIYYDSGFYNELMDVWSEQIADRLKKGYSVLVTIDHEPFNQPGLSLHIRESLGEMVAKVEMCFKLTDLFIEGGATTSVVLKHLNITKLIPFHEADLGIIQMKANGYPNLRITTKPGSYMWPENVEFSRCKAKAKAKALIKLS